MSRVDFYFNVSDELRFVCRLVRKILYDETINISEPLVIFCSEKSKFQEIDKLLYSFSANDFIPHVHIGSPLESQTPVILSPNPWLPKIPRRAKVLINLDYKICEVFVSFDRVIEIVTEKEKLIEPARKKYTYYKNRGYEVHNHNIGKKS